jgi:thymidylate synthase
MLPFNIAFYGLLAQIIGKMVNMVPKGIIADLSNVHIYEPHLDAVNKQLSRDINKHDKCKLNNCKHMHEPNDINKYINRLKISDFTLSNYESYPKIKADMLAYNK